MTTIEATLQKLAEQIRTMVEVNESQRSIIQAERVTNELLDRDRAQLRREVEALKRAVQEATPRRALAGVHLVVDAKPGAAALMRAGCQLEQLPKPPVSFVDAAVASAQAAAMAELFCLRRIPQAYKGHAWVRQTHLIAGCVDCEGGLFRCTRCDQPDGACTTCSPHGILLQPCERRRA